MIHVEPLHTDVILPAFVVGYELPPSAGPQIPLGEPPWAVAVDQQAGGYGMSYPSVVGTVLRLEANRDRGKKDIDRLIHGFRCMAEDPDMATLRRDFALTRFYDPADDRGLGYYWDEIDDALPEEDRRLLLGTPFGPEHDRFDPGRYGSYFRTPGQVAEALVSVQRFDVKGLPAEVVESLGRFTGLLRECVSRGLGLYITF